MNASKSTTPNPSQFLLLFRGTGWHKDLSPEEMQEIVDQWKGWFDRLTAKGKAVAGNPLENNGKLVSGRNGRVVADGPFAESKEAIGGYFLLQVGSFDEALAIAKECPGLAYGTTVEVRPIAARCMIAEDAAAASELAPAAA